MNVTENEKINNYLLKLRKRNSQTLRVFENSLDFVNALKTETGNILLKDLIDAHSEYFNRICAEDTKEWEKGVYRELTKILRLWCERIGTVERAKEEYNLIKQGG
jgi:hypothetical protein